MWCENGESVCVSVCPTLCMYVCVCVSLFEYLSFIHASVRVSSLVPLVFELYTPAHTIRHQVATYDISSIFFMFYEFTKARCVAFAPRGPHTPDRR